MLDFTSLKFLLANVVNNKDPMESGRVQIYVEPLMRDIPPRDYPWASAFYLGTGTSESHGSSKIPEQDSKIWVYPENKKLYRNWFYISDVHLNQFNPHKLFYDNIKSQIQSNAVYPNAKYDLYKNGVCIGVDSSPGNPEIFMSHPNNASIFIDKEGTLDIKGGGVTLADILSQLIGILKTKFMVGTALGPSSSVVPATLRELVELENMIAKILKDYTPE